MHNVLVIGLWGFPGNWHCAKYEPFVVEKGGKFSKLSSWEVREDGIESHSTTIAIAKAFRDAGYDVEVLIYGLDTLACPQRIELKGLVKDAVKEKLAETLSSYVDEFARNDPDIYEVIVERAKRVLNLFVNEYTDEVDGSLPRTSRVLPGIGTFNLSGYGISKQYVYKGSPLNTCVALELDLLKYLNSKKEIKETPDFVVLDISHGINYLPVLGREAVIRALEVFNALRGIDISLAIVNSDPVTSHHQKSIIHVVELRGFCGNIFRLLRQLIGGFDKEHLRVKMIRRVKPPKEVKDLLSYAEELYEKTSGLIKAIVNALSYGLVLYAIYKIHELQLPGSNTLMDDINTFRDKLNGLVYSRSISKGADGSITIEHAYAIPLSITNFLYALQMLGEMVSKVKGLEVREGFVELKAIEGFAEKVGLSGIAMILLRNELEQLEEKVKALRRIKADILERKPMLYNAILHIAEEPFWKVASEKGWKEVFDEAVRKGVEKKCKTDKRNFFAHAGMEKNVIEVYTDNNKIFVGYAKDCLKHIENNMSSK